MSWWNDLTAIVFPMALRVGLPAWIGLALGLMNLTQDQVQLGTALRRRIRWQRIANERRFALDREDVEQREER